MKPWNVIWRTRPIVKGSGPYLTVAHDAFLRKGDRVLRSYDLKELADACYSVIGTELGYHVNTN